jgi:hypothetical protein
LTELSLDVADVPASLPDGDTSSILSLREVIEVGGGLDSVLMGLDERLGVKLNVILREEGDLGTTRTKNRKNG